MSLDDYSSAADSAFSLAPELSAESADTSRTPAHAGGGSPIVTVRAMVEGDKEALAQIMQDSFGDQQWTDRLARMFEECAVTGLVAEHKDEVVGLLLYSPWGEAAYIAEMATKPGWRSRGVGDQLMRFMDDLIASKNWRGMWLHVFCTNLRAQAFYKAHGFEVFGRQPNAYGPGDGNDAYIMISGQGFWEDVRARREVYQELWKCLDS